MFYSPNFVRYVINRSKRLPEKILCSSRRRKLPFHVIPTTHHYPEHSIQEPIPCITHHGQRVLWLDLLHPNIYYHRILPQDKGCGGGRKNCLQMRWFLGVDCSNSRSSWVRTMARRLKAANGQSKVNSTDCSLGVKPNGCLCSSPVNFVLSISLYFAIIPVRRKKLLSFYLDLKELFFNTYENKLNSLSLIISRLGKLYYSIFDLCHF